MTITARRLATARRTVLTLSLCAALGAVAGEAHDLAAIATPGHVTSVTSCDDDGSPGTLRAAVDGASDGDTIDLTALACSLITLHGGALMSPVATLTITGPGAEALTIDGNDADRVIEGSTLNLEGMTLAHGRTAALGGACVQADMLALTNTVLSHCVTFTANSALGGAALVHGNLTMHHASITGSGAGAGSYAMGGAAFVGGSASLYDSTISGNSVQPGQGNAYGGGIAAGGDITLHASTIDGNIAQASAYAAYGGGLQSNGGIISILGGSVVSGNSARSEQGSAYGGGINAGLAGTTGASVTVRSSTVTGNSASSACGACLVAGGGLQAFDSATLEYSTVSYNEASCDDSASQCSTAGGGMAAFGASSTSAIQVRNATISANNVIGGSGQGAFAAGGGLMAVPGLRIVVHNSTIAFNDSSSLGGGIAASTSNGTPSELVSTIVAANHSDGGAGDIVGVFGLDLVLAGSNDMVTAADSSVTLPGDTSTDDPLLLPLTTDNGGITATHALAVGSPAIDAGINPDALLMDQRGFSHPRVRGAHADIGAYELDDDPSIFADGFEVPAP